MKKQPGEAMSYLESTLETTFTRFNKDEMRLKSNDEKGLPLAPLVSIGKPAASKASLNLAVSPPYLKQP